MTDFDNLIKEKVEQAEYAYKPSAWRSFRRMSGMGQSSLLYWIAGISSVAVVGGAIAFASLREPQSAPDIEPAVPSLQVEDTASNEPQSALPADSLLVTSAPEMVSSSSGTGTPRTSVRESDSVENSPKRQSVTPPAEPKTTPARYGRPLVIDVDTIKDNVPSDEELRNGHSRLF